MPSIGVTLHLLHQQRRHTEDALMCFQHTQQKPHIEVQSSQTSKAVLINLLTTTEHFIIHLQTLFNSNSRRRRNQGALLGLKTYSLEQ